MTRKRRCILRSDDLHAPMPSFFMRKIPSAWFLVEKRSWCGNTCSRMNATVRAICCRLEICNLFAVSAANQQALKARIRGRGERIPHQDFAATELRGNFWLPGKILLSKDHVFCFALSSHWSLLKMSFLRFWPGIRLVTKWIYRKQKVVIKWIQLYPAYNHPDP